MGRIYRRQIKLVDSQVKKDSDLVICVKRYPCIYDPSHFSRTREQESWESIAKILRSTADICKERWEKLLQLYAECKNFNWEMHEVLVEQLDEFINIVPEGRTRVQGN